MTQRERDNFFKFAGERRPAAGGGGFSIIELLVVIGIIVLIVAATIPALQAMQTQSRKEAGYNTVAVGVESARQLATQANAEQDPISEGGTSVGTAVLVTNTGSIRLLENDTEAPSNGTNQPDYKDIEGRDYINMPSRAGIVGIRRTNTGLQLLAPPFALRFNSHGNLIFGKDNRSYVYYDGNDNGTYNASSTRGSSYNPAANHQFDSSEGKFKVPFEKIETVPGVIVFDAGQVPDLSAGGGAGVNDDAKSRILEIGRPVFFSRSTGAPMRSAE